jgi:hypothetical protein
MNNFISITKNFNLVIYTDDNSIHYIKAQNNPRIKVIIKPLEKFYNYKYRHYWISNHERNILLKNMSSWELNMLWSEKLWFVKDTIDNKYFETEFYGWCDIGYFRNRYNDVNTASLTHWPSEEKLSHLDPSKITYGCVNNDSSYIAQLAAVIKNKAANGLPKTPIPNDQISFAGGFFIMKPELVDWYTKTYEDKLRLYFENGCLVKDDQIIVADCIFSNTYKFSIFKEHNQRYDNWFMFQRILM